MGSESFRSAGMSRVPPGREDKTMLRRGLVSPPLCLSVWSCLLVQPLPSPTEPEAEVLPAQTPPRSRLITPSLTATASPLPKRTPAATATAEASLSAGGRWLCHRSGRHLGGV